MRAREGVTPRPGLAAARKRAGHNQHALADLVGVTKHTVSQWETGHNAPHPNHRRLIAYHLRISLEELDRLLRGEPLLPPAEPPTEPAPRKQRRRVTFVYSDSRVGNAPGPSRDFSAQHVGRASA
jgi:DNA-binding XRE family transcriptional regulator